MTEHRVTRLPVGWRHGCDGRDCPLKSAVVAPDPGARRGGRLARALLRGRAGGVGPRPRDRPPPRRAWSRPRSAVGELDLARPRHGDGRARRAAGPDRAPLPVQRAEHDRGVLPDPARRGARPRARRSPTTAAGRLRRPAAFVELSEELATSRRTWRSSGRASATSSMSTCASGAVRALGAGPAVPRPAARRERDQARQDRPPAAGRGARRGPLRAAAGDRARQRARHPARDRRPRHRAGVGRARPGSGSPRSRSASRRSTATRAGCGWSRRRGSGRWCRSCCPRAAARRRSRLPGT